MNRTKLMAGLALGLSSLACGTNDADVDPNGLPQLTPEERAVVENMEKGTVAEIDLPEGKMKFVEFAPGEVVILRQIHIGAEVTRVEGENAMTPDNVFRAYAPGRPVPTALMEAMTRVSSGDRNDKPGLVEAGGVGESFPGTRVEPKPAAAPEGTERVSSALASTVSQAWFSNTFCRVGGADFTWCFTTAFRGASASRTSHRTNSVTCGDTGSARTKFFVGGTLRTVVDVPYGQCWYVGGYHHSHGWFGVNNETNLRHLVEVASSTVRFAGWMADEDQFIGPF